MSDDAKKAERRAYQKGYRAGKLKAQAERRRADNWNQAFLAALPACIAAQNWTRSVNGNVIKIKNLDQRTELAADFANESMKYMR